MRRCVVYTHQASVEGDDVGNEASGEGGKETSQRGTHSHFGAQAGHRHTPISKDFFFVSRRDKLGGGVVSAQNYWAASASDMK